MNVRSATRFSKFALKARNAVQTRSNVGISSMNLDNFISKAGRIEKKKTQVPKREEAEETEAENEQERLRKKTQNGAWRRKTPQFQNIKKSSDYALLEKQMKEEQAEKREALLLSEIRRLRQNNTRLKLQLDFELLLMGRVDPTEMVSQAFKAVDENEDGVLSYKDFTNLIGLLNLDLPEEECQRIFSVCDWDESESISEEECKKSLLPMLRAITLNDADDGPLQGLTDGAERDRVMAENGIESHGTPKAVHNDGSTLLGKISRSIRNGLSLFIPEGIFVQYDNVPEEKWTITPDGKCAFWNCPGERCMGFSKLKPGGFLAPHTHPHFESYIGLKGRADIQLGEQIMSIDPGTLVHIPSYVTHGLVNNSDEDFIWLYMFPSLQPGEEVPYTFECGTSWSMTNPAIQQLVDWDYDQILKQNLRHCKVPDPPALERE